VIDAIGNPDALTLKQLIAAAVGGMLTVVTVKTVKSLFYPYPRARVFCD
jgi:hypothetical protein